MEMMLNFGKDDKNFARVTSITFQKHVPLSQLETTGPIDRTPGTLGSIIRFLMIVYIH